MTFNLENSVVASQVRRNSLSHKRRTGFSAVAETESEYPALEVHHAQCKFMAPFSGDKKSRIR
jgi:hypothetical protein